MVLRTCLTNGNPDRGGRGGPEDKSSSFDDARGALSKAEGQD
jgi:hypothetical protein